ncbi:hypothetical protein MHBO_000250 [Bonamia ostreae]|uniref:Cation-transporting P-type ATPase N-terminal domain-containing protein n=1 Tax=Bonamia ostreae TaxID=126728 RepID=A0ABV2AF18_9EUKA
MDSACFKDTKQLVVELKTDVTNGLAESNVLKARKQHGRNETSISELFAEQFGDRLVIILLISAAISFLLGFLENNDSIFSSFVEPAVILLILIANAVVGVVQEINASNAIERLKELEAKSTYVLRNSSLLRVDSAELVPGDIIKLTTGERVPADCRVQAITSEGDFMCNESMLTGESVAKSKQARALKMNNSIVIQDMANMLFSGTLVVRGSCMALVVKTGGRTELGKIQGELERINAEKKRTPLQQQLDKFAEQLSKIILFVCVVVWLINIGHFTDAQHGGVLRGAVYYFKIAVTLAVAAIPEGLPAVVTTCLALGTTRMARKNAIVRTLPSVETLGCTTVICSDKTGTITTNKMNVRSLFTANSLPSLVPETKIAPFRFKLSGTDYSTKGTIRDENGKILHEPLQNPALRRIAQISEFCNEAGHVPGTRSDKVVGVPTEVALRVMVRKLGGAPDGARKRLFDFDRERKIMSTIDVLANGGDGSSFQRERKSAFVHVKGAPEYVLSRCDSIFCGDGENLGEAGSKKLDQENREFLIAEMVKMAGDGLRVLAFAYKKLNLEDKDEAELVFGEKKTFARKSEDGYYGHEDNLVFAGMAGILDPPRAEVAESIRSCYRSGIKVKVITGDHKATAESICRRIGIFGEDEKLKGKSITGQEFMRMGEQDQLIAAEEAVLFSRVEPRHKLMLVRLLKAQGNVVAMTGDGVNDASALRSADIGVAMGSGTQVAQEAADIVLQDDNFGTIVRAVEEGRAIYANTKQFIRYLISSNIGEVASVFLTALFGLPEALIPVQLLWVNLVTDGLPATALGFNPVDPDEMRHPPRRRDKHIIGVWLLTRYAIIGCYIGFATVFGFVWWHLHFAGGPRITFEQLRNFERCGSSDMFGAGFDCKIFTEKAPATMSLSVLVTIEMLNALNAISENKSLFAVPPWRNMFVVAAVLLSFALHLVILYFPFFQTMFSTAPIGLAEWTAVFALSAPVLVIDEMLKYLTGVINEV